MKTKIHARALSWILSICMIAALIPAMPAEYAQAADGDTYVYDFTSATTGASSTAQFAYANNGSIATNSESIKNVNDAVITNAASNGTQPWQYAGYTISDAGTNKVISGITVDALYLQARGDRTAGTVLTFTVPEDGYYSAETAIKRAYPASSGYTHTTKICITEFSEEKEEEKLIVFADYTEEISSQTDSAYINTELEGLPYLYAGTTYRFYIEYKSAKNSGYNNYLYVKNLVLTNHEPTMVVSGGDMPTTMKVDASIERSFSVKIGDSDQNATIEVKSDNEDAVSVSESNGVYTLNALKEGHAKITVTGTYGTPTATLTEEYYITVRKAAAEGANPVYYFSGMINESVALCTATSGKNPDATNRDIVASAINYESTAANLSSPWKVFTVYRSSAREGKNVTVNPNNITITNESSNGTTAYISITNTPGWYTVKTDADINAAGGTNKFTVYNVVNNKLDAANLLHTQSEVDGTYNIDKPIYLPGTESCLLFELAGKTGSVVLNSLTLVPVTDEKDIALEASSEVPETMTVGDEATVVSFKVGVMTPTELRVDVDGNAVTATTSEIVANAVVTERNVTFTPVATGTATVTVTATYGDKEVSAEYPITVKPEISTHEIFGSKYAYVKKNADGTCNVSFIGGLHAIEGFEAAGFEVWQGDEQVAEAKTQLAYKQITYTLNSQTVTKTPSDYGVADATGYIFLETANVVDGDTAYAFTAGTYTIKPYVIEGGEKTYHEIDLSLVIG